jgi:teichuronic acid biosynthesis glycosyltransferase TuaC
MRALFLNKRQYTGKDLIDDRYGRLHEIPTYLASKGHDVEVLCLSYRRRNVLDVDINDPGIAVWLSWNLGVFPPGGIYRHMRRAERVARTFAPDVIVGGSDVLHVLLARHVAATVGAHLLIDLYDNFEAFGASHIPGMRSAFRHAVCAADAVTCVSEPLAKKVRDEYGRRGFTSVVGNAVDTSVFLPQDKAASRRLLGLPSGTLLVGVGGAISKGRGMEFLFEAISQLREHCPRLLLVLAGKRDRSLRLPESALYLGELPYDRMPAFFCAVDVAVVSNLDSAFGNYCFPQKAFEILACKTPLVAADVGVMANLLADRPDILFEPRNAGSLAKAILHNLERPRPLDLYIPSWRERAEAMERVILDTIEAWH